MAAIVETHARIVAGEEAHERDHQHRSVELTATEALRERADLRVEALRAYLGVDLVAQRAPVVDRARRSPACSTIAIARSNATQHNTLEWVKCRAPPRTSQMPSSGSSPKVLERVEQEPGDRPRVGARRCARAGRLPQHVEQLAVHVELQLLVRAVARPHRRRIRVTGQPIELELGEPALARDAVHRLQRGRDRPPPRGAATRASAMPRSDSRR